MLRRVLAQLGGLLSTLVIASAVIFGALVLTPGDPVSAIIGGVQPTPELIAQVRADHHLDAPVWERYLQWVGGILSGDLGQSMVYKTSISALLAPRIAVTATLVAYAATIVALVGIGSGILASRGGPWDQAVLVSTTVGLAMPTFVVAILLVWVFARLLGWFPVLGVGDGGWDTLRHLTLPAVSLAIIYIAYVSRITRGSLVAQQTREHVETARVRGIPSARIFRAHVLRNASPQILAVSGTTFASMFATAAIAEQAFGLGGVGALFTEAASRKDIPVVQVIALLMVSIFVAANALVDIIAALIDPRSDRTHA
ncbi:peptide/nickel transport system permease protein [Quadrisphaera granulorum]|uniref:Peptide/nickel transport system permease protein n=1 Tax=Quadrisphaera granulorum TaxID=317664 RepID=A0A316A7U1_9ACTN|nr:ABC transporter permease [Quadrisphaera granulorum]PWJ53509.1 peptide/nickel transport system permease protein [Quadrisphaera granulorum]SZE96851.1 peptide/nickel transport system permease protein [Quadrisphaera granulorum]